MSIPTINLTRPLDADGPPVDLLPWHEPFFAEDIATLDRNAAHLTYVHLTSNITTRLITAALTDPEGTTTYDLRPADLVLRDATLIEVQPDVREISAVDIKTAFERANVPHGAAVVLRTGLGDDANLVGNELWSDAAYLAPDAADELKLRMREVSSTLLVTDLLHLDDVRSSSAWQRWSSLDPWLRPPWPSDNAKAYLRHYPAATVADDWAATFRLVSDLHVVLGVTGAARLRGIGQFRLTVAPMSIQDVGEAPCTVIASVA